MQFFGVLIDKNSSISGKRGAENIGLAVFKADKLVSELDASQTLCFSILKNEVSTFSITINDPNNLQDTIDISMYHDKNVKPKVDILNGIPYITINCSFNGTISSMSQDIKALDNNVLKSISNSANKYLETIISEYLYKTSKELNSDISDFGNHALSKFATIKDFEDFNWNENYRNAFFKVTIDTKIKSGELLTQT